MRGAALLGGIVLALAGLYLFQYTIERGLISPTVRVMLGTLAGLACVVGSEWVRKRGLGPAADALAGGGLVALYAAFWAAHGLYHLVGPVAAFVLIVVVTVAACVLAAARSSALVAGLGLFGGFLAPISIPTALDQPASFSAYLLLLAFGMVVLGRRCGWPWLGWGSALAAGAHLFGWLSSPASAVGPGVALPTLGLFGLLFLFAGAPAKEGADEGTSSAPAWRWTQAFGLIVCLLLVWRLVAASAARLDLLSLGALLAVLVTAAAWLGDRMERPLLPLLAAGGALVSVSAWWLALQPRVPGAWKLTAVCVVLPALLPLVEWWTERRRSAGSTGTRPDDDLPSMLPAGLSPAGLAASGFFALTLLVATVEPLHLAPWLTAWAGLSALLILAGHRRWPPFLALAAVAGGLGLAILFFRNAAAHASGTEASLTASSLLLLLLGAGLAWQAVGVLHRHRVGPLRVAAETGAALLPLLLVAAMATQTGPPLGVVSFLAGTLVLGLLAASAAVRLGAGGWYLVAMAVTAVAHTTHRLAATADAVPADLLLRFLAVLVFTAVPFAASPRFDGKRWAWWAAALAGPAWFLSLWWSWDDCLGDAAVGLLPLAVGALSLLAALAAQRWIAGEPSRRLSRLVWFSAVALGFAALAIPLQLDREWLTLGWSLEALATLLLWRRLDHPGLKYFALALHAAVTLRLVANPALLGYHEAGGWPILNWLAYTYLVPVAALLASAALLAPLELTRLGSEERSVYALWRRGPWGAILCGGAAIVVFFAWLNLTIFDAFSRGAQIDFSMAARPARDLTLSLAWATYALLLLGIGIARRWKPLRWIGFVVLMMTIVKVFLIDLRDLEDLWRVASLVGLALSLLLVSVVFSRFLGGSKAPPAAEPADPEAAP